ncbi:MAG TPA: cupin domain-containing protein [Candidatus Dormibacteraeota bacterium]|nr:cupin domain-containing protein [Candidatus Dormibacteraeota bacterium]
MTTPVAVHRLEAKSHDTPDEVRTPAKTRVEIVRLEGYTLGRFRFEPGWRWSECIKPVVMTDRCQLSHVGHVVSGRMTVELTDGRRRTFEPGQSYAIPPGHDAWVEGDEPFVALEVMSAEQYAKA